MPIDLSALCADLAAEHADLDRILAGLSPPDWDAPTPAAGWLVRDQVAHLASGDTRARLAATDPAAFEAHRAEVAKDRDAFSEQTLRLGRSSTPADLLAHWRAERDQMLSAFRSLDPAARVPWYGPAMSAASFITARLMETWAHGQDIVDTVGAERVPTPRLRHIAHIGVRARPYSYSIHNKELPREDIYVELEAPGGETWRWGDAAAPNRIRGSALDFCLVVTQRRHRDDTDLVVEGPLAEEWLSIAQAFAGPPGTGRRPRQYPKRSSPTAHMP
jgi:uncharacterized protein (TIGR03084 family)